MARQAVAISPPPGKRSAVVAPPRDRRRVADIVTGVLGALLLIGAVVLVPIITQDPPPPPQFEVRYESVIEEDPTVIDTPLTEGSSASLVFPYAGERLYRIEISVAWVDDVASSLPDEFQVVLRDPAGNVAFGPGNFSNPPPSTDGSPAAPIYTARPAARVIPADIAPRPSTEVVTGEPGQTLEDIQAAAEDRARTNGTGDWTLEVTLLDAGDCPDLASFDVNRYLTCQAETGDGSDEGNVFTVEKVVFITYDPVATPLV